MKFLNRKPYIILRCGRAGGYIKHRVQTNNKTVKTLKQGLMGVPLP